MENKYKLDLSMQKPNFHSNFGLDGLEDEEEIDMHEEI